MSIRHAVVWLDQHDAKIFHFDAVTFDAKTVLSPQHHVHKHPSTTAEHDHPNDAQRYYHEVARALEDAEEILVVGPAKAKLEFIKHVHKHNHVLDPKIVGVETVDHPTDGQLLAYARRYFSLVDHVS